MRSAITTGLILIFVGMIGIGIPVIKKIRFDVGCGGYLKSAADAPIIKLAKGELDTALEYMTVHKLYKGHSHLIIPSRQADVGYWYLRIETARKDLDTITKDSTGLEKSNMLMKLRETLLDEGESGTEVTLPPHIAIFPLQWFWIICMTFGTICTILGGILIFVELCAARY